MAPAPEQQSALYIERLHNHYLVAAEHQAPEEVRSLCEAAIASTLPHALSKALNGSLPFRSPGLWFIRRLEVDFAIDTEINSRLAETWAEEIAGALLAALQTGEDPGILYFPDRAAYLANFLLDLAERSAWGKWYYAAFEGLRMLPASAALRTAICDSPETGLQALSLISETTLSVVMNALTATDAHRVLAVVSSARRQPEPDDTPCFQAIANVWPVALGIYPQEEDRRALLLFLAASRKQPELAGVTLRSGVLALAHLAKCLQEGASRQNQELLAALRERDMGALYGAGSAESTVLAPLLRCAPECLGPILQCVMGQPPMNSETPNETRFTAFGGAFFLLPLLDEFPFENATAGWPEPESITPSVLARFLVLAKCFGESRAAGCFRDALLRDLMQISPRISPEMVADWLQSLSADALWTLFHELAKWHAQTGAVGGETFLLTSIEHGRSSVAILLDTVRALWLFALEQNTQKDLIQELHDFPLPRRLLCSQSLWQAAQQAFPQAQLELLPGCDASPLPSLSNLVHELTYLSLPGEFCGACAADLALSVAAQCVLRLFACKLPGFARSSLNYLYSNFLDCCAAVEEAQDQRVVCVGRPPLHLVLGMAGQNRCNYRLSWLDGRPCAIFPEG